ncbi:MAG: hypothetical protein LBG47_09045 [Prevotellaceae bacterium]|jgi:glucosylceramidase|nr:hypothetical protein [Prevotellaceae bacterium]
MSRWGWQQNSLVTVNPADKTYKLTYEYFLLKHASHYVLPGARLLPVAGAFTDLLAFRNADGAYVLILHNGKETEVTPVIRVGKRQLSLTLKPKSYNTIVLPG